MKTRLTIFLLSFLFPLMVLAQESETLNNQVSNQQAQEKSAAINVGVLCGGGSLIGADLELKPSSRIGLQAGLGISSYGFGLNYHLSNRINSSFISFKYMNQGFGINHYASYVGPEFVFRAKKIFQAGIGLGYVVSKGTIMNTDYKDLNVMMLYHIGLFFPL